MPTESYVLKVREVIQETEEARSIVFDVPEDLRDRFTFKPGQFLTIAVPSEQSGIAARCYSLSSTPGSGEHKITVKRTESGYASNWIAENVKAGHQLRVLPPSGIFTPPNLDDDLLLFAAGSGITPIMSIANTELEDGKGRVVLFYANRDEHSVIFARDLSRLQHQYEGRFTVVHWLESVQGVPTQEILRTFAGHFADFTSFVCGPTPFMSAVVTSLKELGFPRNRRHQEKFVSLGGNPFGEVDEIEEWQRLVHDVDDHEDTDPD